MCITKGKIQLLPAVISALPAAIQVTLSFPVRRTLPSAQNGIISSIIKPLGSLTVNLPAGITVNLLPVSAVEAS